MLKISKITILMCSVILSSLCSQTYAENDYYDEEQSELSAINVPAVVPLGDSASNVSVRNNNTSSVTTINGMLIDKYNCSTSACTTGCTTLSTSRYVLWNIITVAANSTVSVGKNYLYNLLTIVNNAGANASTSPCSGFANSTYIHISVTSTAPQGSGSFTSNGTGACIRFFTSSCNNPTAAWDSTVSTTIAVS